VYFVDNGDGTATVSWTPPVQTPGTQIVPVPVTISVKNAEGVEARQGFSLIALPQTGPTITPIPNQSLYAGPYGSTTPLTYSIQATGFGNLTPSVANADPYDPTNVGGWVSVSGNVLSMDPTQAIPRAQPYRVRVSVMDGNGVSSAQDFLMRVYSAHTPLVTLTAPNTSITTTGTLNFHVAAFDPGATSQTLVSVQFEESTDGGYTYSALPSPPSATPDSNGMAAWDIPWQAPSTPPSQDPMFLAVVTDTTGGTTMGSGESDLPAALTPAGEAPANQGLVVRVYASSSTAPVTAQLHVPDVQPVVIDNIPVYVTRAYDSAQAGTVGDFGYGWSLDLGAGSPFYNSDLYTSTSDGSLTESGQRITVIAPNGVPEGFTFRPRFIGRDTSQNIDTYVPDFVPDSGVTDTLAAVSASNQTLYMADGDTNTYHTDAGLTSSYYADYYTLTIPSGVQYQYTAQGSTGTLASATFNDPNGTTVDQVIFPAAPYSGNTVVQGSVDNGGGFVADQQLTFIRGGQNRVSSLVVTRGGTPATLFTYGYDPTTGVLSTVTDYDNAITSYSYNPDGSHPYLLTGITRGPNTILTVGYNAGVPTSATAGTGGAIVPVIYDASIGPEIHTHAYTLTSASPVPVAGTLEVDTFICDGAGHPLREMDPMGAVIDRTFDGAGAVTSQTAPYVSGDPLRIARTTYDGDENVATATDAMGNRGWSTWSSDKLQLSVDALGNETTNMLGLAPGASQHPDIMNSLGPMGDASAYTYAASGLLGESYQLSEISTNAGSNLVNYSSAGTAGSSVQLQDPSTASTTDNYDTTGNLSSTTQSHGSTSTTSNSTGALTSTTVNGLQTQFINGTNGIPIPSASPDGATIFTYDPYLGVLMRAKVPSHDLAGAYSITDYDVAGRVLDTIDALGNKTTYTLDADGRVISTLYPGTAQIHDGVGYDTAGRAASRTDVHGSQTTQIYDAADRQIQTTYPDGSVEQTVYDAAGRPIAPADRHLPGNSPTGSLMFYNTAGNLVQTQFVTGIVIAIASDGNGVYHSVLTTPGTQTATRETVYNAAGMAVVSTDSHAPGAAANATQYSNDDQFNNVTQTQRLSGVTVAVAAAGKVTDSCLAVAGTALSSTYDYYSATQLIAHTDAAGQTTQYQYDNGRVIVVTDPLYYGTTYQYDPATGRKTVQQDPLFGSGAAKAYETDFAYNQTTGVETTTYHHNGGTFTTTQTVDGAGNVISSTDGLGRTTTFQYTDPSGQLTQESLPQVPNPANNNALANPTSRYTYDAYGNLQDQYDALSRDTHYVTNYNLDGSYSQTRTLPGGNVETTTYDSFGRISTHTDFKLQYTTYTYDPTTGRLTQKAFYSVQGAPTASETLSYLYDPVTGAVTQISDANAGVTTITSYAYDPITLAVASVTTTQGTASSVIHYAYDPATGQHIETWTGTSHASPITDTLYTFDELGRPRIISLTWVNGHLLATPQTTTDLYDPEGNLARVLLPNGVRTVNQFDDLNRLFATSDIGTGPYGDVLLGGYGYTLGQSGRRDGAVEQRGESDGTFSTTLINWTYDNSTNTNHNGIDWLTSEQVSQTDAQSPGFNGEVYTASYTYDLVGNRLTMAKGSEHATYTYDTGGNDRLMSIADNVAGNSSYQYDDNGSMKQMIQAGVTTGYVYDKQNRLYTATTGSTTTTYSYDPNSNRIKKSVGSSATWYLVDANNPSGLAQVLQESSTLAGTPTTTFTLGTSVLSQTNFAGTGTYLLPDGRGSTRLTADAKGNITARYDYDAFGTAINFNAGSALTKYLYDNQQYDATLGQYYLRARDYITSLGRFSAADSYVAKPGDLGNADLYTYSAGNAVNMSDPSGHELAAELGTLGAFAALSALVLGTGITQSMSQARHVSFNLGISEQISGMLASGQQVLMREAVLMASDEAVLVSSISSVMVKARAVAANLPELPPMFPILKSAGASVYALDVGALAINPAWFVLNYNGPSSPLTAANRLAARFKSTALLATMPAGQQLDEFPYASTTQGGASAITGGVPWRENAVQGGLLIAFYRYSLKSVPLSPFLVVPIPL